jgi:hypothetical protein
MEWMLLHESLLLPTNHDRITSTILNDGMGEDDTFLPL